MLLAISFTPKAQPFSFFHLSASDGLSDNYVRSLAIDKNGFLWIGTEEGLNVYNGYDVVTFSKEIYPQMPASIAFQLTCDRNNNIWMGTSEGVVRISKDRDVQRIILKDTVRK